MDRDFSDVVRKYAFVMIVVFLAILVSLAALSAAAEAAPPVPIGRQAVQVGGWSTDQKIQIGGWSTDQQSAPLLPDDISSEPHGESAPPQTAPLLPEDIVIEERWSPAPLPSASLKGFYGDGQRPWGILPEIPKGPRLEDKVPHVELIPGPGFGREFMEKQNRFHDGWAKTLESYSTKPATVTFEFKTLEQRLKKFWCDTKIFFKDYWGGILVITLFIIACFRIHK